LDYATAARWNADTFGDDQYAEATVVAIGSTDYVGVAVRWNASAATDERSGTIKVFDR